MTRQIVITIEVPDGVQVSVTPSAPAAPLAAPEPSPSGSGAPPAPKCDQHPTREMKASQYGGFYCTHQDASGTYCDRRWDAQTGYFSRAVRARK